MNGAKLSIKLKLKLIMKIKKVPIHNTPPHRQSQLEGLKFDIVSMAMLELMTKLLVKH